MAGALRTVDLAAAGAGARSFSLCASRARGGARASYLPYCHEQRVKLITTGVGQIKIRSNAKPPNVARTKLER